VNAIILAAGVARRMAPLTDRTNKCLLPVGGRPLLARLLEAVRAAGLARAVLVVGHCADQIHALAGERFGTLPIEYVVNPDYPKASVLSLWAARRYLDRPVVVMDADVLCPRDFLVRLLRAPAPSALLVDRAFQDSGEEVKAYTRGDRIIALGKKVVPETWEQVGENVGFFKCGAEAARVFLRYLEKVIAEGAGLGMQEWEDAIHFLARERHVGWVDVTGMPWTEIDFPEDLRRAEADVLPHVARLDGA
jgi:choline kinase